MNAVIVGIFMLWADLASGIIDIIIGIIVVWAAGKINDGKETTIDKIIWIILLVLFVVYFLVSFIAIFTTDIISLIANLCGAIIYLFMIAYLFDNDVKKAMGM